MKLLNLELINKQTFQHLLQNKTYYNCEYIHINKKINFFKENKLNYNGFIINGGHEYYDINFLDNYFNCKNHVYCKQLFNNLTNDLNVIIQKFSSQLPNEYVAIHYRDYVKKYDEHDCKNGTFVDHSPIDKFL